MTAQLTRAERASQGLQQQAGMSLEVERQVRYSSLSNTRFELIIFPTEQCNFRCTYCYEDFAIGRMNESTVSGIEALLERRAPSLRRLHLSYFGGEPLLGMKAIRRISRKAIELSIDHGFEIESSATTNAYLLNPAMLEELVDLRCDRYQISLDGWGAVHDETRKRRRGQGSFDTIWQNLLDMKATDLNFHATLRIHLMPGNEASIVELVENINAHLDDERFVMVFKKVGDWGGQNEDHPDVYKGTPDSLDSLLNTLKTLARRRLNEGVDEVGGSSSTAGSPEHSELPEAAPYVCYASMGNSLVIRANGRINKCTVALDNPKNDIGCINEDGTMTIDSLKLKPWLGGLASLDEQYLGCPASRVLA